MSVSRFANIQLSFDYKFTQKLLASEQQQTHCRRVYPTRVVYTMSTEPRPAALFKHRNSSSNVDVLIVCCSEHDKGHALCCVVRLHCDHTTSCSHTATCRRQQCSNSKPTMVEPITTHCSDAACVKFGRGVGCHDGSAHRQQHQCPFASGSIH